MRKTTVTILNIKQVAPNGEISTLTLAFSSRERALSALPLHLANAENSTSIDVRTLEVISDA